jgi:hypothetical protein
MRRLVFSAVLAAAALSIAAPHVAHAQGDPGQEEDAAAKKKKKDEWEDPHARLPQLKNAGPCPFVKVLYDAARYQEFEAGREASAAVGYTGEIQGISAACEYKSDEPITVEMELLFELGKGPAAKGQTKTYRYWIAVTHRNEDVLAKQFFELPVKFPDGQDRLSVTDKIDKVTIPRAKATTSGSNFEILVGFDVTPEMAAFNRDGKRFRVNAGTVAAGGSASKP